jgi:hypothetical protein
LLLKNENKIEEALSMNMRIYNQIIFSGSFICATTHHKNERVRYLFAMKKKSDTNIQNYTHINDIDNNFRIM